MAATIKHLIVLMMENRSFDHMFGYIDPDDDAIDDLSDADFNPDVNGTQVLVSDNASPSGLVDPGHKFLDVNEQIFGRSDPQPRDKPTMKGFVKNYAKQPGVKPEKARDVMKCFSPDKIPVLTTLAREFALCDAWFSSVPGPTLPNRAFAHCGSSNGSVDNHPQAYLRLTTVYERLAENGVESKVYAFDGNTVALSFPFLLKAGNRFLGSYEEFLKNVKNGTLPPYSFVEPRYNNYFDHARQKSYHASDQHPPHDVLHGENLIADVYEAVRKSPLWQDTLLVVTYDEHGGLFDHVEPPKCTPPQKGDQPRPDVLTGFDFSRLGIRVPTVLISPFIDRRTVVKDQLEHASLIKTALKLFAPGAEPLTARDRDARTFDGVLNRSSPRDDADAPKKLDRKKLTAAAAKRPVGGRALSDHQSSQVLTAYRLDELLPAEKRVLGTKPEFKTLQDIWTEQRAVDYIREVSKKARAHWDQS